MVSRFSKKHSSSVGLPLQNTTDAGFYNYEQPVTPAQLMESHPTRPVDGGILARSYGRFYNAETPIF